jgi:4-amino-4-deoxy-L-arabinose transferase-like glycosyltransferase
MKIIKEHIFLIIIILLGGFLRFFLLGTVPFGVTHEDLGYIFNAYSIAFTGRNVFGQFFPFLTWMVSGGFPFMPVPIYFSSPFFWFFGLSATTGRMPSALMGTGDIILLYILVYDLFRNKTLALLSSLFLAISPWSIHFNRTAYDPNFSSFFYLLGIVTFIQAIKRKQLPVFSLCSFLLGIYSYRGMSIIAIPLLLTLSIYAKAVLKASAKQLITFGAGIIFIIVCLLITILHYGRTYIAEGQSLFINQGMISQIADDARNAKGQLIIKRIFINKPVYVIDKFRENYLQTFSPNFLFLHTEDSSIYSIWSRGRIYFIDIVFIIFGCMYLYKINKKAANIMIAFLLIGALPGGIGGKPYSARDLFMSFIFPVVTAGGVIFLISFKKHLTFFLTIAIIGLYTYSLGSYLFDYYEKYAYQNAEAWAKSLKDVSFTILHNKNKYAHVIVGPVSHGDFIQFAFYAHLQPKEVQNVWRKSGMNYQGPFQYKNITFVTSCPTIPIIQSTFITTNTHCLATASSIGEVRDYWGNIIWKEYAY